MTSKKQHVKDSFNFDEKELKEFLHKHNMKTEDHFKRNKGNASILQADRARKGSRGEETDKTLLGIIKLIYVMISTTLCLSLVNICQV
jgi:hypothetical protein